MRGVCGVCVGCMCGGWGGVENPPRDTPYRLRQCILSSSKILRTEDCNHLLEILPIIHCGCGDEEFHSPPRYAIYW